jgi:hypothetical protein
MVASNAKSVQIAQVLQAHRAARINVNPLEQPFPSLCIKRRAE